MSDLSLVDRLRYSGLGASWGLLCKEAADMIEQQAEEIERLRQPVQRLSDEDIDASTDAQWGKGCVESQYKAHRAAARAIEALVIERMGE